MPVQNNLLYPLNQIAFDNSQAGVNQVTYPTLLIAQTLTAQPFTIVPVTSLAQARALFGRGSRLARMFEAYFANDTTGPIYCLPLADATGNAKATGTAVFTGTATAAGTIFLYVGGQLVQVGVSNGDTAAVIATNAAAAVNALPDLLTTATAATGTTTFTARNGGTLGNLTDLRVNYAGQAGGQSLPAGTSVAITAMAGGATDPDLTTVAAVLGDTPMRFIVHDFSTSPAMAAMAALMNFSTGRWSPTRKTWGHVFTAKSDTIANLATFGGTNNDPHSTVFAFETGSPSPECEASGAFAGAIAASLRTQPNLPLQTLQIGFYLPPPVGLAEAGGGAFSKTTWQTLLGLGLALPQYAGGNTPQVLRAPTTYQTNAFGQPDQSYFDTEDMFTLMVIADMLNTTETQKWARALLADDGTAFGPGLNVVTPKSALAELLALYNEMQALGLVEDAQAMLAATTVQRDLSNPSQLDITFAPFIVVGLRQVANTIQFRKYSAAAAAAIAA